MENKAIEVVAALIRNGNRFLACRRPANKARALLWEFVGGKVEPGETGEQALAREIREELGAEIAVLGPVMDVTHEYPDLTVHLTLYSAAVTHGEPQALEHSEIRWITADEIDELEFCPADQVFLPAVRKVMESTK